MISMPPYYCTPFFVPPSWCRGYHCCLTSFIKVRTQVLRRFKSCSRLVGDLRWWGSLTIIPAGNKARRLSSVNHTTKAIHYHHHTCRHACFPEFQVILRTPVFKNIYKSFLALLIQIIYPQWQYEEKDLRKLLLPSTLWSRSPLS